MNTTKKHYNISLNSSNLLRNQINGSREPNLNHKLDFI